MISITKEYRFEAAHRLPDHPGHCKNVHGHSYKLVVTVGCQDDKLNNQCMVMDFVDLGRIVKDAVVDKFDHAVVLYVNDSLAPVLEEFSRLHMNDEMRVVLLDAHPTAEYMAQAFAMLISDKLRESHHMVRIEVWETAKAYATWDWTQAPGAKS